MPTPPDDPDDRRWFVALWPSTQVTNLIHAWQEAAEWTDGCSPRTWRPVARTRAHLTLAFLPHVDARARAVWLHAASEAAAFTRPCRWRLSTVGGFPRADGARVAFLAPDETEGGAWMRALHHRLLACAAATAHRWGVPIEVPSGSFQPHVTVARTRHGVGPVPPPLDRPLPWDDAEALHVIRSTRQAGRHAYVPVARIRFKMRNRSSSEAHGVHRLHRSGDDRRPRTT